MMPWALTLLVTAFTAQAAERAYAVLSLVGDRISVVRHAPVTGSNLDRSQRESFPVTDGSLDRAMLAAVDRALRAQDRSAKPVLLFAPDAALYEAQDRMLDEKGAVTSLLDPVRALLRGSGATHLILATRYRHEAEFERGNSHVGTGILEGAGFYVDRRLDARGRIRGFLGPYLYFQLTLVDLATGTVVAQQQLLGSNAVPAARSDTLDPWDALSPAQKVEALARIARREASKAVPELVREP
jgi:hypothetical protein